MTFKVTSSTPSIVTNEEGVPEFIEKVKPFTGIMGIEFIPRTEVDLLRKPVNFISTNYPNVSLINMLRANFVIGQMSINERRYMGLFAAGVFDNPQVMDLYVVVMKQLISLVRDDDKRFQLIADKLITDLPDHPNRQSFMETSTFCDILVTMLAFDRKEYRNVQRVVGGSAARLHTLVENAMSYYLVPVARKSKSKTKPRGNHLNKSVSQLSVKPETPPNPAMELAFKQAQEKPE